MSAAVLKQALPRSRVVLFAVWASMMIVIIAGLMHEDRFFAISGKPVAYLKTAAKEVTFRTEDDVKWKAVGQRQGFFDGDRVATGTNSSARVDFGEGRSVDIDQDSIIAISSIRESTGNSFIINLVKGGIKPVVPPQAKHALVVMSGTSTFVVEPGEERGFVKPTGGVLREFSGKEKFPARLVKQQSETEKFILPVSFVAPSIRELPPEEVDVDLSTPSSEALTADAAPTPIESIAPTSIPTIMPTLAPKYELTSNSVSIVGDSLAPMYVTTGALSGPNFAAQAIKVKVKVPTSTPAGFKPFVSLSSGEFKATFAAQNGVAQVLVTSEMLQKGAKTNVGPMSCINLELRAGADVSAVGGLGQQAINEKKSETRICSLLTAKEKLPLIIGLTGLQAPISDAKLFPATDRNTKFPIEITVTRASDYIKLLPYIRSASAFKINGTQQMDGDGIFSVDAGKVIAQLDGGGLTPQIADKVMQILGSTFVFKGKRSAIHDASGLDVNGFKNWITQNTAKGLNVYIRAKSTLIPISRDFMEERQEVADFVKKASGTIFLEKVEIIAYR